MCERLPGDRCSHHVKLEVDKKTLKAASIFVASGVASPQELTGRDKEAYDSAVADLRAAQEELAHTPTEIKKRAAEARTARAAGNIAYAEELENSVATSESLRARRKAGLKHLKNAEVEVGKSMSRAGYKRQETREAKSEVEAKIKEATAGLSGEEKEAAILKTARDRQAVGRREIARLKKARTQLDKDLSKAVDSGNAAEAENTLDKIQKNIQKISFANTRNAQYDAQIQDVLRSRSHAHSSSASATRSYSYSGGGCGGGCGAVHSVVAGPAEPATSLRNVSAARSRTSASKRSPEPAYVRPAPRSSGCGGGC